MGIAEEIFERVTTDHPKTIEFVENFDAHLKILHEDAPISSVVGRKTGWGTDLRLIGSVPPHVHEALRKVFGDRELCRKDFWRWFFGRYPQYSVRSR